MTKVWLDALTPKQLLLAYGLRDVLLKEGYEVIVTSRVFTGVEYLSRRLGFKPIIVGGYGKSLYEKLEKDLERALSLLRLEDVVSSPVLVSYPSPSAVRTAFGLAKKIILLTDTPHAFHAHRLTLPLANYVIHSSFIEHNEIGRFLLSGFTVAVTFRGVDELVWVNRIRPDPSVLEQYDLPKDGFVIVRPPERYASYYSQFGGDTNYRKIVEELSREIHVVLIPRYDDDAKLFAGIENVSIIDNVLTLDLLPGARLVITGGATMAREASLLGVPSIYTFETEMSVNKKLREHGFPIYHVTQPSQVLDKALQLLSEDKKYPVDTLRSRLEDPSKIVINLIKKGHEHGKNS